MLAFVGNTCHCNWYVSYLLISVILLVIVTDSTGVASTYFAYKVAVSDTVVTGSPVHSAFVNQPANL